jgi:hypothetical protein
MQHIEEAGVHSGDSSQVLPAHALPPDVLATIRASTRALALELGVVGLMNVQFAVRGSAVFVIEVNPRASRTVPFVARPSACPSRSSARRSWPARPPAHANTGRCRSGSSAEEWALDRRPAAARGVPTPRCGEGPSAPHDD